ncbi:hypothetical protein [Ectobacillus funiculus]|uniref:hypothetical protein n=1 Tax=Ectobacillus funiculus TaxID=137993 RepID=UPI00101B5DCD|nr:hypothetical protein [Ectobacillus funiculus]
MNVKDVLRIEGMLSKQINVLMPMIKNSEDLYRKLCDYLIHLAETFGYHEAKVKIKKYASNKNGYMDVVWFNKSGDIKLAIAVDGGLRKRSIKKLRTIKTEYRLWVYYENSKRLESFLQENDLHGKIMVINLHNIRKQIKTTSNIK